LDLHGHGQEFCLNLELTSQTFYLGADLSGRAAYTLVVSATSGLEDSRSGGESTR